MSLHHLVTVSVEVVDLGALSVSMYKLKQIDRFRHAVAFVSADLS
jgi:hypothetical protein